jgi:type VI secretion system protein ImpA
MTSLSEVTTPVRLAEVIDIEALMAPIPGDYPAGEDTRYSGLYDNIREARRQDEDLNLGDWVREIKTANWEGVVSIATEALATRTKDLQISAWLAEAVVKLYGFNGLQEGLRLVWNLVTRYWDSFYPNIEEGDMEARENSLLWMDRKLAIAVREIALTNSVTGTRYSYNSWEASKRYDIPEDLSALDTEGYDRVKEIKEHAAEEGKITSEQWRRAVAETSHGFYAELSSLLDSCVNECAELENLIKEKFEYVGLSGLPELSGCLRNVQSLVRSILSEKRSLATDTLSSDRLATSQPDFQPMSSLVHSRVEALRHLKEVAAYFRVNEPHSPVSYLIERAIRWGQMPLELWLREVIKNDQLFEDLRDLLGIRISHED